MATANSKPAKYESADLEAALEIETRRRVELEESLRQTRDAFEEFILTAAHDLREPLRTVSVYSELLTRNDERPEAETDQYRRYILDGTGRMQSLIAGMVEYAGAASNNGYLMSVDLNEVFADATAHVTAKMPQRTVTITRDQLPVVKGDFEKLVKVARHLLDNAARYCENSECRVHISAERVETEWLIIVHDNGPGIEEAYYDRIFEPFKRLHGRQYAGCGLGLTYCRRAIENGGGRIWVESGPDRGSTFFFTVSAAS